MLNDSSRLVSTQESDIAKDGIPCRMPAKDLVGGYVYHGPGSNTVADRRREIEVAAHILERVPAIEREALLRFYRDRQPAEFIQATLRLTPREFQALKRRAKRRFVEELGGGDTERFAEGLNYRGRPKSTAIAISLRLQTVGDTRAAGTRIDLAYMPSTQHRTGRGRRRL